MRDILLEAHQKLGWRAGITYSSYTPDQTGNTLMLLLRGINNKDSIRLSYVSNVDKWWPPVDTLAQMGVPTLAANTTYNYFAYAFWTCGKGPEAITKVYHDPVAFLGTQLGETKEEIQDYIYSRYKNAGVKLMVSAFGATEEPVKEGLDAVTCGNTFVKYISENKLDGVDIDY